MKLVKVMSKMPKTSKYFHNTLPDHIKAEGIHIDVDRTVPALASALDYVLKPTHNKPTIYLGEAGIAYACWHVAQHPAADAAVSRDQLMSTALHLSRNAISSQQQRPPEEYGWSLLVGESGCLLVSSLILNTIICQQQNNDPKLKEERDAHIKRYCYFHHLALHSSEDEFLYGKAGYLFGCLLLNKHIKDSPTTPSPIPEDIIMQVAYKIIERGRHTATAIPNCPSPLYYFWHDSPYLGAAHGMMGIVYVLLDVYEKLDSKAQKDIQGALHFVLSLECNEVGQSTAGGGGFYPSSMEGGKDKEPLVHWCHGSPGAVFLFAKASQVFSDGSGGSTNDALKDEFRAAAERAGEIVWSRGLLKKGPGACHGVSGNAHAMMYLWKCTGEDKWLHRAVQFSKFMESDEFKQHARVPDHPHSLFEGWGAACCLYGDLLDPDNAVGFPLYVI